MLVGVYIWTEGGDWEVWWNEGGERRGVRGAVYRLGWKNGQRGAERREGAGGRERKEGEVWKRD